MGRAMRCTRSVTTRPYEQIAEDLAEMIKSGQVPEDGRLPSTRQLAREYEVSVETVNRAYAKLQAQQLVERRPGVGMFVREAKPLRRVGPHRYARSTWRKTTVEALSGHGDPDAVTQRGSQRQSVTEEEASEAVATALRIRAGDPVVRRARVVTREGHPTHIVDSYYRAEDVAGTPIADPRPGMAGREGSYAVLASRGLEPTEMTEDLYARAPTEDEKKKLKLGPGEPVVETWRTVRTETGRIVEYAHSVHAASRFIWSFPFKIPD